MRVKRRTAARILATAVAEGRTLTVEEKVYLALPDKQDPKRTVGETGAAYLQRRLDLGLTWDATGKQVGEAKAKAAAAPKGKGKGKAKAKPAPVPALTFSLGALPKREDFANQGEFLRACKGFKAEHGLTLAEARKALGNA